MQNKCSDAAGSVVARVELLREEHVGKLAVMVVPANVSDADEALAHALQRVLRTGTVHSSARPAEAAMARAQQDSRRQCY